MIGIGEADEKFKDILKRYRAARNEWWTWPVDDLPGAEKAKTRMDAIGSELLERVRLRKNNEATP